MGSKVYCRHLDHITFPFFTARKIQNFGPWVSNNKRSEEFYSGHQEHHSHTFSDDLTIWHLRISLLWILPPGSTILRVCIPSPLALFQISALEKHLSRSIWNNFYWNGIQYLFALSQISTLLECQFGIQWNPFLFLLKFLFPDQFWGSLRRHTRHRNE